MEKKRKRQIPDLTNLYNDYMHSNMQLADIAAKHGMSRQTLHKIIKEQGWTPRQPRLSDADKQRVAETLRDNPNAPLTEIAARCDMPVTRIKYLARRVEPGVQRTRQATVPERTAETSPEALPPLAHDEVRLVDDTSTCVSSSPSDSTTNSGMTDA
jgi:hypothetical protein